MLLLCQKQVYSLTSNSCHTRRRSAGALRCSYGPQQGILAPAQHSANKVTQILSNVKILKATPLRTQDAENAERSSASEYQNKVFGAAENQVENFI